MTGAEQHLLDLCKQFGFEGDLAATCVVFNTKHLCDWVIPPLADTVRMVVLMVGDEDCAEWFVSIHPVVLRHHLGPSERGYVIPFRFAAQWNCERPAATQTKPLIEYPLYFNVFSVLGDDSQCHTLAQWRLSLLVTRTDSLYKTVISKSPIPDTVALVLCHARLFAGVSAKKDKLSWLYLKRSMASLSRTEQAQVSEAEFWIYQIRTAMLRPSDEHLEKEFQQPDTSTVSVTSSRRRIRRRGAKKKLVTRTQLLPRDVDHPQPSADPVDRLLVYVDMCDHQAWGTEIEYVLCPNTVLSRWVVMFGGSNRVIATEDLWEFKPVR